VAGHLASDDCGPSTRQLVGELLEAVELLAVGWRTRRDVAVERLAAAADAAETAELRHRELAAASPAKDACDRLAAEERRLLERANTADCSDAARTRAAGKALADWEALVRRQDQVRAELKAARERWQAARVRQDDLSARLAAIPVPDVTAAGERLREATEALRTAEEAAGALKAYRDAVARAKSEQVSEAAWKAAEAASKRARETYVADVVRPLVDDVAALLAAAGRSERVYLELENERGKPVFDLGWVSGDSRRSLSALSGGEAVLFCAALAVTIARRSTGRKVLLIEADPLDEENLAMLLSALSAMDVDLDAVLIATSTEVPSGHKFAEWVDRPARWKVIRFEREEAKAHGDL
jgi:DNA repair exonuclease SbcCD ATPase subunit